MLYNLALYAKCRYEEEARIRDFYVVNDDKVNDDKVVFRKVLT